MSEIATAVQDYLQGSYHRDYDKHKERRYYVSDMGKCHRMRWLKRKGVETEFEPHVLWILKIGDLYHDFGYKALEAQGRLLESEDYVGSDHFVGRYDGIVKDKEGKAVLDMKSISKYGFQKILNGNVDERHIAQILTYQMFLQDEGKKKGIKKSILLYMNKEPSDNIPLAFMEKHFYLHKKRERQLREEIQLLTDYWEEDKIPKCTCELWEKKYNAFQPFCEMNDRKVKTFLKHLEEDKRLITSKTTLFLVEKSKKKEVLKIKH